MANDKRLKQAINSGHTNNTRINSLGQRLQMVHGLPVEFIQG